MDNITSVPRTCEVCGRPLRRNNKSGICGSRNPACKAEWDRRHRDLLFGPATGRCSLCGGPVRRGNVTGICKRNPDCIRERRNRARRKPQQEPPKCAHPDGCPREVRTNGLCNMHAKRLSATGELGPVGSKLHPIIVNKGDVFGLLTALEDYDRTDRKVLCFCECGTVKRIGAKALVDGASRSCRCRTGPREARKTERVKPGEIYGYLTVLETGYLYYDLVAVNCECGTVTKKTAGAIKTGRILSCGCAKGKFTHGLSKHPLYGIWRGILGRTLDPNNAAYPNYGGRGITVCERWQGVPGGLLNFAADMGPRPGPEYSIDRTNNDGPYSPENCRWETKDRQSRNQRKIATLTRERDDLAARVAELERLLAGERT